MERMETAILAAHQEIQVLHRRNGALAEELGRQMTEAGKLRQENAFYKTAIIRAQINALRQGGKLPAGVWVPDWDTWMAFARMTGEFGENFSGFTQESDA